MIFNRPKIIWGICALTHRAAITVVCDNKILFARHSENYSGIEDDPHLHKDLISAAKQFGEPDEIVWAERPMLKKIRRLYSWQWRQFLSTTPKEYLMKIGILKYTLTGFSPKLIYKSTHESYAAAGYYTSPYNEATIIVDEEGEWDTTSIWYAKNNKLTKICSIIYPNSIADLRAALMRRIKLIPNKEEQFLTEIAQSGTPVYAEDIYDNFIDVMLAPNFKLKENFHQASNWRPDLTTAQDYKDIAASMQHIVEVFIYDLVDWATSKTDCDNLVLMGNSTINCIANEIKDSDNLIDIWTVPSSDRAWNSLGCILAHTKKKINIE